MSEGTCAACGKALGSVIENHIHGQRLYHASCCPACRTPPEQARVEQRHLDVASRIDKCHDIDGDFEKYQAAMELVDFERDIRAEMKREVLAEIDEVVSMMYDNAAATIAGRELKHRVEAIE